MKLLQYSLFLLSLISFYEAKAQEIPYKCAFDQYYYTDVANRDINNNGVRDICEENLNEGEIVDTDNDGIADEFDNCPRNPNPDQINSDADRYGDVCDLDDDSDLIIDFVDNCRTVSNPDQTDLDGDRIGDACDPDIDGDAINNQEDNCPYDINPDQADIDGDGIGYACDIEAHVAVSLGVSCYVNANGQAKCWGRNEDGQLGQGHNFNIGDDEGELAELDFIDLGDNAKVRQISVNYYHICALLTNNQVKCWGSNARGQLGIGPDVAVNPLMVIRPTPNIGDNPEEMGNNLLPIDLGTNEYITKISNRCALFQSGRIKCWGRDTLAVQQQNSELYGNDQPNPNDYINSAPGEMGENLPFLNLGEGLVAKDITVSSSSACALFTNNQIKCWGTLWPKQGQGNYIRIGDDEIGDDIPYINIDPINSPVKEMSLYTNTLVLRLHSGLIHIYDLYSDQHFTYQGEDYLAMSVDAMYNIEVRGYFFTTSAERRLHLNFDEENIELIDHKQSFTEDNDEAKMIATGENAHVCALFNSGRVKCHGTPNLTYNRYGELGTGEQQYLTLERTPYLDL